MAEAASQSSDGEYHHGEQPVAEHVATWHAFMWLTKWFTLHIAVIIIACTLWFCVGASFLGGLIPALIVFIIGARLRFGSLSQSRTH